MEMIRDQYKHLPLVPTANDCAGGTYIVLHGLCTKPSISVATFFLFTELQLRLYFFNLINNFFFSVILFYNKL